MSLLIKYGVMAQVDSGKKTVFTLETTVASGNEIPIYLGKPDTNILYISVNGAIQHTVGTDVSGNFNRTLTLNEEAENVVKVWVNQGSYDLENGNASLNIIGGTTVAQLEIVKSAIVGNQLTSIGEWAFYNFIYLTQITMPNSLTHIGARAFSDCKRLTEITIPINVTNIETFAFSRCETIETIVIPNNVTDITNNAFSGCISLLTVVLPASVTNISFFAFYNCTSLTSITLNSISPPSLAVNAFDNTNNCPIYVPSGSVDAYKAASNWSTYAGRITAIA